MARQGCILAHLYSLVKLVGLSFVYENYTWVFLRMGCNFLHQNYIAFPFQVERHRPLFEAAMDGNLFFLQLYSQVGATIYFDKRHINDSHHCSIKNFQRPPGDKNQ